MKKHPTNIEISLDDTVKDIEMFQEIQSITINKIELFKYAIMMFEVPTHIKESDFDYLQSKVPGIELLLSDYIELSDNKIANLSSDDRIKKLVSEAIGVSIGLKYSVELLKVNPNMFKKIAPAIEGKYLDYSVTIEKKEYEIETKGTVSKYYSSMKQDILDKKSNVLNKPVYLRFGTIAIINNKNENSRSQCVIVDDPPEGNNINTEDDTFRTQILNYTLLLSYILDSKYYNKFVKPVLKNQVSKAKINSHKFYGKYEFYGKMFLGEYFDYRLIKENYNKYVEKGLDRKNIFGTLTKKIGKTKFFIGIEVTVVEKINDNDVSFFRSYSCEEKFVEENSVTKYLDKDGILIVKSENGQDKQIENIFPESVVKYRLGLYNSYLNWERHQCGAPCTSRGIEGKPCEIKTFRAHCHFHR